MTSSSFDSSKVVPCESTPLDRVSSGGGPVPQAKKKPSRSFVHVIVTVLLVFLAVTVYTRLSSSVSPSSIVDQSVSKSENKVIENDSIVFPTASLAASESKTSLRQAATGKSTIDTDDRRVQATRRQLKFPDGVFEDTPENRNNARYMFGIIGRCNDATNKNDREVLACQIYESVSETPSARVKMALGTIKTNVDILDISNNGNIKVKDVTSLFEDYAVAVMIERECFSWSSGDAIAYTDTYQYNSENDYSNQFAKSSSIDVSTSAGYGPITVSAGYQHAKSSSSTSSSETTTAFGSKKYFANIGSITNNCLTNKGLFRQSIKDLLKPEWTNRWKRIRDYNLSSGDDFEKVANGGFYIPTMYNYETWLTYMVSATYLTSDASQSKGASNGISAGLGVSFRGAEGSASTQINKAMTQSNTKHEYTGTFESHVTSDGISIDQACLNSDTCPGQLVQAVKIIHAKGGLSKLDAHATSISALEPLDDIIKWYFDSNTGLPDDFHAAVGVLFNNYGYSRPGTVCWAYEFEVWHPNPTLKNKHNCWTTNENVLPTAIVGNSKDNIYWTHERFGGVIMSPHPTSCCNHCESTYFCNAKCHGGLPWDTMSKDPNNANNYPLVHDACRA